MKSLLRYSLQTLLLVGLIVTALILGYHGHCIRTARIQKTAVDVIREHGGSVGYDFQYESKYRYNSALDPPGPACVVKYFGIDYVGTPTHAFLADQLDPQGALKAIARLHKLEMLKLGGSNVTDDGLAHVSELENLEWLGLMNTRITDAGIRRIRQLGRLTYLDLRDNDITDQSVTYLKRFTQLEYILLQGTLITEDGIATLRRSLPRCTIKHQQATAAEQSQLLVPFDLDVERAMKIDELQRRGF